MRRAPGGLSKAPVQFPSSELRLEMQQEVLVKAGGRAETHSCPGGKGTVEA